MTVLDREEVLTMLGEARLRKDTIPDIEKAWRTAIRAALALGVPTGEVADVAGCTVARVYQVRDGRR